MSEETANTNPGIVECYRGEGVPPVQCPFCKKTILPVWDTPKSVQLEGLRRCNFRYRDNGTYQFISYYEPLEWDESTSHKWRICELRVNWHQPFGVIHRISPRFIEIYNEAKTAESLWLRNVSGAGYRKALEFLVMDYVFSKYPEDSDRIEKLGLLGNVAKQFLEEKRDYVLYILVSVASWLGNDYVHYIRKFPDKDIEVFHSLISLIIATINLNNLTPLAGRSQPGANLKMEEVRDLMKSLKRVDDPFQCVMDFLREKVIPGMHSR